MTIAKFGFLEVVIYLWPGPRCYAWCNSKWHETQRLVLPCQWLDSYGNKNKKLLERIQRQMYGN